ncbi:UDP-glucose--hexose-1-phosphate uridylyltransferase [Anaerocolumna xylanovorans]|uniref:Galactose-1-phosphate uridylyltransferase n=1 Tax=Anaerocolumna xylanovorans DSM 12503 TaxID=1121345 RepID=A0A1M7Y098_9FIRM|nr:UDP-glucose--hexose-1-phosphate uridylyltransferase [Anaerocolumna xylanovorans]SHO44939.1 UDPglucose--hexose-1-phosphate uridylyltransferase [Anaerocolumna xylanovorans DSM 12503]
MIYSYIRALAEYALNAGLIQKEDRCYTINRLLEALNLEEYEEPQGAAEAPAVPGNLEDILRGLLDYAADKGILKSNSIVYRDLFDTKLMGLLLPTPSEVIHKFYALYEESPRKATDYYYKLSQDSDYIRRYRIVKDRKWVTKTEYGNIDITINLSKPEKDPKAIAEAKLKKQSGYPKCLLCVENEGYAGRVDHPARQNHRIIPVIINNQEFGFQYSPYVYYNEHCIVLNREHTPMKVDKEAFRKLFDFVKLFPHYFVGSNADLPIVGGSILTHDHFQGGNYAFAMAKAPVEKEFKIKGYEKVQAGIVKWPMSVIRLKSREAEELIELGDYILKSWRNYTDEEAFIYAYSDSPGKILSNREVKERMQSGKGDLEPHNTITPIARRKDGIYEFDLVLRNNVTTKEHPLGVYHPHSELHHIKKENIGLIEVMGLAVLPARLKEEMEELQGAILSGREIGKEEEIYKHKEWMEDFLPKYQEINAENINDILQEEIGLVFLKVLEHAGVYKRDAAGQKGFERFIAQLNNR